MVSSARRAIACLLFICIAAVCAQSQVAPSKTATISGKVTLKNKGLAGVLVAADHFDSSPDRSRYRATTDQTGKYRITNVAPGTYQIGAISPGLVYEDQLSKRKLVIEEGDNIEDVNFSMARGGVITGKITDADGKPVVEQMVFLQSVEGPYALTPFYRGGNATDDRGVYRVFGLHAGKYKVYVGQGDNRIPGARRVDRQIFYPSVTDPARATVVEVTEGGEATDIDIMMGRPITAFKVTGKIVDGETGKPVPYVRYGILEVTDDSSGTSSSGAASNANGEFKFEGVLPGKYSVFIETEQNTEVRADPVPFEVVDRDVTGLVVKTVRASSVSGVVVLEGVDDPAAIAKLGILFIYAMYERRAIEFDQGFFEQVRPDGSFRINGLSEGVLNFALGAHGPGLNKQFALVRIERDGIILPGGVTIKDGEQLTGLRLTVKMLTATIRGQLKVEDGELPANAHMQISVRPLDQSSSSLRVTTRDSSPQIDSRGRFVIEGLAGGTYEISIGVFEGNNYDTNRIFKQQVTVADNSVSEVTMTIKLKP
jgi:protocatechuate 3,4-dioxygenase beta subunit